MKAKSYVLGTLWWALAYVPIIAWYTWRRVGVRAMMEVNSWYHLAWNFMWMSHYFVFQLPAIIWPLTYLGSQTVNHFYILINFWIGTIGGGAIASIATVLWIVAAMTYEE